MLSEIKPKLNPLINVIAKPFSRIHPNILSLLGIIPPFIFLFFMLKGEYIWALVSFAGLFLDTLDGAVARMTGKMSAFGGLLDSTLDRIADAVFICAFAFCGLVDYPLAFILLILSYAISYIRSRAELAAKGSFVLNVGLIERPERLIILFIALLGQVIFPGLLVGKMNWATSVFIALIIFSSITMAQRFFKAKELLQDYDAKKKIS